MTISTESLRELHRIHRQLADLKERFDNGPKQLRAAEAYVKKNETDLAQAKEAFTKARVASDEKQLQLKQREDRVKDLKIKLNAASSNREYQALKDQIAADEQANSVLTDEILEAYEKLDELKAKVASCEAGLKKAREEGEKTKTRISEQQASLESEIARVTAEMTRVEQSLPLEFRVEYDRIAKARGDKALGAVEGDVCGNCFQMLTTQQMSELYLSKAVFCRSCGCLLYIPEDHTRKRGN